ncbi:unnamed protein product [Ilex paraguariensis]|uniref:50S ribosomal protein 5, chloroplastic n=1 Tax=Ilex paraguariensis TaxID=185542 RepID=A0ABC8RIM9_9AQUA
MALLVFASTSPTSLSPLSSSSFAPILAITANPFYRLQHKPSGPQLFDILRVHVPFVPKGRGVMIVKASSDVDGMVVNGPEPSSESDEENMPIENLPLESKLQLKLEQKMKMKLAKKIRLRRKKLVRKRRLRKKGRWPPSKLKKNKNV